MQTSPAFSESEWLNRLLWPLGQPFRGPQLADFVVAPQATPRAVQTATTILARDGLLPLLWFFHRNPTPQHFGNRRLFVHEDIAAYVPEPWRENVGTYRLTAIHPAETPREILFYGLVAQEHSSVAHLEQTIAQTRKFLGADLWKKIPKTVCLTARPISFARTIETFHTEYLMRLGQILGPQVRIGIWHEVLNRESYEGCLSVSLNDRTLCADNVVEHLTLSRGGLIPGSSAMASTKKAKKRRSPEPDVISLSPNHAWIVHKHLEEKPIELPVEGRGYFENVGRHFACERADVVNGDRTPWPPGWAAWLKMQKEQHV